MRRNGEVGRDERRLLGAHYTPQPMAEAFVAKALAPILETGKAILDIRICDPAMGDGALLIEVCRQLATALDEPNALSQIAQNCIYGVDVDIKALQGAKERFKALVGVTGDFRQGNSLLSLTAQQIHRGSTSVACEDSILSMFMAPLEVTPETIPGLKVTGDKLLCDFFAEGDKIDPFHWELEFPDVFAGGGFDLVLMNPPYMGKTTLAQAFPERFLPWLKILHEGAHGNADLAAHFLRYADTLTKGRGVIGIVATNTIAQGDTRETGLKKMLAQGWEIYNADTDITWPGEAAVTVSIMHLVKGL